MIDLKRIPPLLVSMFLLATFTASAQTRTIHVFVALCDNANQGIVPVPAKLGNGQDPNNNLYWGAMYGIKSYFHYKAEDWKLVASPKSTNTKVLERVLFKHKTQDVYLLAEAYDGKHIKACTEDFLTASAGQQPSTLVHEGNALSFGGKADLMAYIGHDGLMEFSVYTKLVNPKQGKDVIILACYSKEYFAEHVKRVGASPLLWTTHLMAPEAYTLEAAIDGWIRNESDLQIEERAAQAYNKYQKCGIKGARNLFTTGFGR